ncbi:MAG: S9 family peptidase [Planctomycetaceae bacterium]|nr:S9 family peptidase [Planctomycetaceae bacterium]
MNRLVVILVLVITGWIGRNAAEVTASDTPEKPSQGEDRGVPAAADTYSWLEEIESDRSLEWVRNRNEITLQRLQAKPKYDSLFRDALAVLESKSRIPELRMCGNFVYRVWDDERNPRGVLQRTTVASLLKQDPQWETVLDIDALGARENRPWAFDEMHGLPPGDKQFLLGLSPGGGDAAEVREFNAETRQFVEGGFRLPAAKSRVAWIDEHAIYVGTDFGDGSLTESGYPRIVKKWKRSMPLSEATTLYEADRSSISVGAQRIRTSAGDIDIVTDRFTFWRSQVYQILDGKPEQLDLPETARIEGGYQGCLVVSLKEEWSRGDVTFPNGSVLVADPAALRGADGKVLLLVQPTESEVVESVSPMPQGILVTMLDSVRGRLYRFQVDGTDVRRESIWFPDNGALNIATKSDETGDVFVRFESFLTPPTLYHFSANAPHPVPKAIAAQAPAFDDSRFQVQQLWTTSLDGTRIPYFVVGPKEMQLDGRNPVWMFSYGGFGNSLTPSYSGSYEELHGAYGKLWLEQGGVFVLANIRGGGEFGPAWHTQALKADHVKTFEDFEAVARDLAARRITSPRHLGIEGRSNGGLLVASTMIRHPELYGAIVCGCPLIDMQRYNKLLAGASWVGEYGNPDQPEDWEYLSRYSPYQNVQPDRHYPPIFFYSSTRDDRVHPGHARKMAARMDEMGYEVEYFESTEGGHHGSVTNEQLATRLALSYTFLWEHLAAGD